MRFDMITNTEYSVFISGHHKAAASFFFAQNWFEGDHSFILNDYCIEAIEINFN